jgi:hypothetical protein
LGWSAGDEQAGAGQGEGLEESAESRHGHHAG